MELAVSEKVLRYESFVNDVLKEDLRRVNIRQDTLNGEIAEYIQLKNFLQTVADVSEGNTVKTKMDLGCGFYVQANIQDSSKVLVNIGLGHYVEFTAKEALKVVENRIKLLMVQTDKLKKDSAKTKALIKLVLGGLHQLQTTNPSFRPWFSCCPVLLGLQRCLKQFLVKRSKKKTTGPQSTSL